MRKFTDVIFQDTPCSQHSHSYPGHCRKLGKYCTHYDRLSINPSPLHNSLQDLVAYVIRECAFCEKDTPSICPFTLLRVTTILVSRFFLDLREASDTSNSSSATNGILSTINFAVGQFAGNLGEPLDHSNSTWISGAQDDIAEDGDNDERFSFVAWSTYTR